MSLNYIPGHEHLIFKKNQDLTSFWRHYVTFDVTTSFENNDRQSEKQSSRRLGSFKGHGIPELELLQEMGIFEWIFTSNFQLPARFKVWKRLVREIPDIVSESSDNLQVTIFRQIRNWIMS